MDMCNEKNGFYSYKILQSEYFFALRSKFNWNFNDEINFMSLSFTIHLNKVTTDKSSKVVKC